MFAELQTAVFGLGLALVLLAAAALAYAYFQRQQAGLPAGAVIYSDSGTWFPQSDPLFDAELQLVGKPDYLIEQQDGLIIPVEVKSKPAPSAPHEGHVLQLAAYCLLVESNFGVRPSHGIIQYKDKAFAVDYTPELEDELLELLDEMRVTLYAADAGRNHEDWRRCAGCGLRHACYERLG